MIKSIWWKTLAVFFCFHGLFLTASWRFIDEPIDKYEQTLHAIGKMLKLQHYEPRVIDDELSAEVLAEFLNRLDPEKNIFTQADILLLQPLSQKIDDEINGQPLESFPNIMEIYKKRIAEVVAAQSEWLALKPIIQENTSEYYTPKQETFPKDERERRQRWLTKIKYSTLERYVENKELRDQSKIDSVKSKTDASLWDDAFAAVKKQYQKIFESYQSPTPDDDYFSLFANSLVNLMDPHSEYFLPVEKRTWNERLSGKFYGIGATIGEENGFLKLTTLAVGGPAWKSGEVDAGDLVLKVGQGDEKPVDVTGFSIPDGVKLIRGENKTVVSLTLKKLDGSIKLVKLVREELKIEETFARSNVIRYQDKKLGVINLPKFYTKFGDPTGRSCAEDVAKELDRLKADTVDGIIIDLRGNGGGSLSEVVNMVGLFIPEGPVVQVKGKSGKPGLYVDRDAKVQYSGPLMVMVNEFSASASEIFAAAIQDYRRGIVIGSGTYGKGTVQRPYDLNALNKEDTTYDLGNIHITMQKYYRINGSSVQLKGVVPDIHLNGYYENHKLKEKDEKAALPWDLLSKQDFKVWSQVPELPTMQEYFQKQIDTAGQFSRFSENSTWLANQADQPKLISETAYKELIKNIREKSGYNRDLLRLSQDMDVYGLFDGDTEDKIKIDRNNRVTNFYKRDRYLQITAELLAKWIDKASFTLSD
jgi:carboxyl-terminal processing protease